jgi:hypothetical protein
MVLLAATSLATSSPQQPTHSPAAAAVQATATVRVVTGVVIKLGARANADAPPTQETVIHSADGSAVPAKLVEFQ